ncbi:TM2 domain-containing protein [Lacinutrix jangbogonensis]|uniref:TM2 domain-containing protein n=1 Tax=Lacinutrix jangbogonensis TaxID=1469557 RepID=UPI00053E1EDD|nr:TM2 domain-containing protein [Lacinutrix jangbogonensis]
MKIKLLLSFLVFFIGITTASASFPVKRATTTTVENTTNATTDIVDTAMTSPAVMKAKDQTTAILLWLFLGGFAAHRWYLGSPIGWNILFILTAGFFLVGWVIDGVEIITNSYPGL